MRHVYPKQARVIALGDIHGDLKLAKTFFLLAKLINRSGEWIGGSVYVVQIGDQLDSCRYKPCDEEHESGPETSDDIGVILFFEAMDIIAKKHGGRVISLIGNHEIMNTVAHFGYVSHNNLANFEYKGHVGEDGRAEAFKPGGCVSKILSKRLAVVIIGSNLFVHAGLLPKHLKNLPGKTPKAKLTNFNKTVQDYFLGKNNKAYDELNNSESLFWTRLYGGKVTNENREEVCGTLETVLKELDIKTMIIGHTPQKSKEGINSVCDDQLFRIDGGFATGFFCMKTGKDYCDDVNYKRIQYLEILNDSEYKIVNGYR